MPQRPTAVAMFSPPSDQADSLPSIGGLQQRVSGSLEHLSVNAPCLLPESVSTVRACEARVSSVALVKESFEGNMAVVDLLRVQPLESLVCSRPVLSVVAFFFRSYLKNNDIDTLPPGIFSPLSSLTIL